MPLTQDYEKRHDRLAPVEVFYRRVARNLGFGIGMIVASLAVGMAGYIYLGKMSTVDAFLNAAMILSGMGPVGDLPSDAAKIFAGLYAIYSGIIIIATAGVLLAPALHRMLHRFHMADESEADAADKRRKR